MADDLTPSSYTPETPGSEITFTKPNIPDCWTPSPVTVATEGE